MKSKTLLIARFIYKNWKKGRKSNRKSIEAAHGSTHSSFNLSESLKYINSVFNDYLRYSSVPVESLKGRRILEIGPGDNLGVALLFLASGAEQVIVLDKIFSKRDAEEEYKIYKSLREQLGGQSPKFFDDSICLDKGIKINPSKLKCIYGYEIENAGDLFEPGSFDFIVSRAVLEEIWNIDRAFSVMDKMLAPGGYLLHKIDLRDYGIFSKKGMHPLTFLTIPDFLYELMTSNLSQPNRKLVNYYKDKMLELGYDAKIFITHIAGRKSEILPNKEKIEFNVDYSDSTIQLINEIRPKLQSRFQKMSNEELMVSGMFLVAKKRG